MSNSLIWSQQQAKVQDNQLQSLKHHARAGTTAQHMLQRVLGIGCITRLRQPPTTASQPALAAGNTACTSSLAGWRTPARAAPQRALPCAFSVSRVACLSNCLQQRQQQALGLRAVLQRLLQQGRLLGSYRDWRDAPCADTCCLVLRRAELRQLGKAYEHRIQLACVISGLKGKSKRSRIVLLGDPQAADIPGTQQSPTTASRLWGSRAKRH